MPELPEVETVVRACRPGLLGRTIVRFASRWPRQAVPSVSAVLAGIAGRRIVAVERRAKFIVMQLDSAARLLVHLKMSGRLEFAAPPTGTRKRGGPAAEPPHVRAVWEFDDGSRLLFCDARKFGRIVYTPDWPAFSARLGIEPLGRAFSAQWLLHAMHQRARQLKPLLLDQSVIAGLGNIYVDEALHRAGLHPLRRSDTLSSIEVARLRDAIRQVLKDAIRHNGTTFDWIYPGGRMQNRLKVYGRQGEPCARCCAEIVALRVGQRGTHICPHCQPLRPARLIEKRRGPRPTRRIAACAE